MRPSWQTYFSDIAVLVATRSTCLRRQVGAILVKDNRILATGYNGAPKDTAHCEYLGGCLREKLNIPSGQRHEICRAVHAEQSAIIQAAKYGVSVDGAFLYCTHQPCSICAKMIINCGIKSVFYLEGYPDDFSMSFFEEANINIVKIEK